MIDYNEWAREEREKADALRSTLEEYFPETMAALVKARVEAHEERAQFLTIMSTRAKVIW